MHDLKLFSGTANPQLSQQIGDYLGVHSAIFRSALFPMAKSPARSMRTFARDVFLIQPTCPPVNDNIMQLLVMIDSCLRASAERITAVIPYFGYARQDRKTKDEYRLRPNWWPTSSPAREPTAC